MNLLAGMADMLVMVVRSAVTSQDIVRKAIKALKPSARMGVILTAYAENNLPKYMRQYYIARTGLMAS
jgi:Mrp family chromosome partitioning ATPase